MKRKSGFTLIELLIVVAIIAILAAIAIPNFLAAQIRSKVSRVKAEIRTLSNASQAYYVDNNTYPLASGWYGFTIPAERVKDKMGTDESYFRRGVPVITTPISYISSIPNDVFNGPPPRTYAYYAEPRNNIIAETGGSTWYKWYSVGPDQYWDRSLGPPFDYRILYDPSNGTVSNGDIARLGGETWWSQDEFKD